MSAECGSASTQDGVQHFQMQPGEPLPALLVKTLSGCADHIGHLNRWPGHLSGTRWVGTGGKHRQGIQRTGSRADMPLRNMDIDRDLLQITVAEENLDGAQV